MVDAIVSKVVDELGSIVVRELEQEVRLVIGVEKEVEKLKSNFCAIQAVLVDAEERKVKEASVKHWLEEVKAVSYDVEDVLDEWNTAILKSEIEGHDHDQPVLKPKGKVCTFIRSPCFCCGKPSIGLRHDIAQKIKELNERLDEISKQKSSFSFTLRPERPVEHVERQITASVVDVSEVEGRESEKDELIRVLLGESSQPQGLQAISIVGMGGLGKTTLAQLVYNDDAIKKHFDKRIWVCVSDPFEQIKIAKAILESLLGSTSNAIELEKLLQQIQQSVAGKRFFLVLDDVWEEDYRKWKQLHDSLKSFSLPQSRILVTTRKVKVANVMGCTEPNIFQLGQLSEEKCWSIFSRIAFSERTSGEQKTLEDIGREIVDRCKGLPLAVKTIAGLLRFKESREQWQVVLDSKLWELEEGEKQILAPLWLSYYDLSLPLKQCFSFCAVFPKDELLSKRTLIELWMAEGYLRESKGKDMEVIGGEYFQNLALRCLFQDLQSDRVTRVYVSCKMHDIVHDLAELVREDECFSSVVVNALEGKDKDFDRKATRHAMIRIDRKVPFPSSLYTQKKLRTLLVKSNILLFPLVGLSLEDLFNQLACLRSLELSACGLIAIPSRINKLIHLRVLNLSLNPDLKELPETVYELYNLQTLDISGCRLMEKLPPGIERLINLMHLICRGSIKETPKGVGRLTGLSRLDEFIVSPDGNGQGCSLLDLKGLNLLRESIRIYGLQNVKDINEAKQAQLHEKKHLRELQLDFLFTGEEEESNQALLEALQPPRNLETLKISNYRGRTVSPRWLESLTNLKVLEINKCKSCQQLPEEYLQKATVLQELRIYYSPILRQRYKKEEGQDWSKISHIPSVSFSEIVW